MCALRRLYILRIHCMSGLRRHLRPSRRQRLSYFEQFFVANVMTFAPRVGRRYEPTPGGLAI